MSDLSASIAIFNKNNVWIDDNMVIKCHTCSKLFGIFIRKHHCRCCGNIFCYTCTNQYIVIPDFILDRPNPADYWNLSYYITSFKNSEERVCVQCYKMINDKMKSYQKMVNIFENPISIDKIKELPEDSSDIKKYYFDQLRNIQYYLPNHVYDKTDKNLLLINSSCFSGHSKYLVHLIKSIDWGNHLYFDEQPLLTSRIFQNNKKEEKLEHIIEIINGGKTKTCSEIYCTRTCQEELSCDDCTNILYSTAHVLPDDLLQYLFDIIMKTPEQVILCHLSFFITLIKNNNQNPLLQTCLFRLLNKSDKLRYHCYWFLNNAKQNVDTVELANINSFIQLFDYKLVKLMGKEYSFYAGLINHLDNPVKYLSKIFDGTQEISLPYDPTIKLIDVDLENITVKQSYTKPVNITFKTTVGKINLLFKNESIMNDVTVLNLMILSDIILSENLEIDFGSIIYPIMPLTSDSGMIQIIDDAETMHDIINNKNTVLQHIISRNENKIISDVLDRYMYSLVSYTLHSYFIGVGDRHLQNIMITDDGGIFHIDFGFILGTDAYPLSGAEIKLNSDMLEVIGGMNGDRHMEYFNLCSNGIVLLRKYFNMFFILLSQNDNFKKEQIDKFVMSRFQPRQSDHVVVSELMAIIKQSNNAYSDYIRDFLHYHTQEKTVQNGITSIFKNAYGTVKNFTNSH